MGATNENWAPLDGWAEEGETLTLAAPMKEPRLAQGVRGWAFNTNNGIYITAIRAEEPGSGHVSRFLDMLPVNQRVVFPVVISPKLRAMLDRRGFVEKWEIGEPYHDDVPVMERRPEEPPTLTGPRYYDRLGNKISSEQWVILYDQPEYRRIRVTAIGGYKVSTLWSGIDHKFIEAGAPVIFVTSLLVQPTNATPHWTRMEAYTTHYTREQFAREGHEAIVGLVCQQLGIDISQTKDVDE
jgi:hypothetical protein